MAILATPYRIRCKGCKHPGKFHNSSGCCVKKCDCKIMEAEEMEHELCIDGFTMKQICVQCSSDKNLEKGLCGDCRKKKKESESSKD